MNRILRFCLPLLLAVGAVTAQAADTMRVGFAPSCPVSKQKLETFAEIGTAILAQIGGSIVGGAVDALADYLTKTDTKTLLASHRVDGLVAVDKQSLKLNGQIACVIVVVADKFDVRDPKGEPPESVMAQTYVSADSEANASEVKVTLYRSLGLVSPPKLYFEALITVSPNGKAFGLSPGFWYYGGFLAEGGWRFQAERDVLLEVSFSSPGSEDAYGSTKYMWTAIDAPALASMRLQGEKSPWMALPEVATGDGASGLAAPSNIKVVYAETSKPHTLLKYIGDALRGQKDAISQQTQGSITLALSEQARNAARATAVAAVTEKLKAYNTPDDEAVAAAAEYKAATTTPEKQKRYALALAAYASFNVAKTSAALAYKTSGLSGFPDLALEPLTPPA